MKKVFEIMCFASMLNFRDVIIDDANFSYHDSATSRGRIPAHEFYYVHKMFHDVLFNKRRNSWLVVWWQVKLRKGTNVVHRQWKLFCLNFLIIITIRMTKINFLQRNTPCLRCRSMKCSMNGLAMISIVHVDIGPTNSIK